VSNPVFQNKFAYTVFLYVGDQRLGEDDDVALEGIVPIIPKLTETTIGVDFNWEADFWKSMPDSDSGPGWGDHWEPGPANILSITISGKLFGGHFEAKVEMDGNYAIPTPGSSSVSMEKLQIYLDHWIVQHADDVVYPEVISSEDSGIEATDLFLMGGE